MSKSTAQEIAVTYYNGNISVAKRWVRAASKIEVLELILEFQTQDIEYYSDDPRKSVELVIGWLKK